MSLLQLVHLVVPTEEPHQLLMIATLDDLAVVEHKNLVGALNRRQAMGNDEGGPPLLQAHRARPE